MLKSVKPIVVLVCCANLCRLVLDQILAVVHVSNLCQKSGETHSDSHSIKPNLMVRRGMFRLLVVTDTNEPRKAQRNALLRINLKVMEGGKEGSKEGKKDG